MVLGILEALGVFPRELRIGFSGDDTGKHTHGKVALRKGNGSVVSVPFVVDHPEYLNRPTWSLIDGMFAQIRKLGYEPVTIEFKNKTKHMAYKYGVIKPVLALPL